MISVLSRLQLLNGNKFYLLALIFLFSCSPKVVTVKAPDKTVAKPEKTTKPVVVAEKSRKFAVAKVALLLPFQLEGNPKNFDKKDVEQAQMAIDFYQGFKLGFDSASENGQNFKINVIDSKGRAESIAPILERNAITGSDLIVGPVFPESIKQLPKNGDYYISPLAATMPTEYNNPRLISLIPNIVLHASKMAEFILKKYNQPGAIVVLITPKHIDNEPFYSQLKKELVVANSKFIFQEYASINTFETKLQAGKQYAVIVNSSDKSFVIPGIDKLAKIKKRLNYAMDVFGHPNWAKQTYNTDNLQALNTTITAANDVNYKRQAVIDFIKIYRATYNFEPGEYAFSGFDTGLYFGKLIAKYGQDYMQYLVKDRFTGLQHTFSFYKDAKLGYINNGLKLMRYKNYQLSAID